MKRPKKDDFNHGDHITDWLYWEQKYSQALNIYIDYLEIVLNNKRDAD